MILFYDLRDLRVVFGVVLFCVSASPLNELYFFSLMPRLPNIYIGVWQLDHPADKVPNAEPIYT